MRRVTRRLATLDLARLPMLLIAGALVTVSGLFSVSFAWRTGEPSGNAAIFALLALAIDGYAAFAMPVLWPRLPLLGRLLLIGFLVPCLAYKVTAAHRFAAENLSTREAAREQAVDSYEAAEHRVKTLRDQLGQSADARDAGIIQAEIDGLLRTPGADGCTGPINGPVTQEVCPKVDRLRTELAKAQSATRIQDELSQALRELSGKAPVAVVSAEASGPAPWLLGLIGYSVGSFTEFVATLIMLIVEVGSVAVPALVGFARREGAQTEHLPSRKIAMATAPELEETPPKISSKSPTEGQRAAAAELIEFLGARTARDSGEKVQSTALYAAYTGWAQAQGRAPITVNQFGTVLTQHLGLTKLKRGGVNWYLNIRLTAPQAGGRSARRLQAVGGQAS
jgi:hypothetical protein